MVNLFRERSLFQLALLAAILLSVVQGVQARGLTEMQLSRLDPSKESTSVLLESVRELLKNDQLEEALPFLDEILNRLEGDEDKKARQTLAYSMYQLAHCEMKLGNYTASAKHFIRFAEEFPDDPQNGSGRVLASQCLTMLQLWQRAGEQAAIALENANLGEELKVTASQLLAEAYYQQEQWDEAIKPLITLFQLASKEKVRTGAAVMLVTCYVRLDDYVGLFTFLPHCDETARYHVALNVALLEAGDSHYNQKEYQKALLLYRQVMLRQELIAYYEDRIRTVQQAIKPYVADGKQTLTEHQEKQLRNQGRLDRMSKQYKAIMDFEDYDTDVALRMAQCYNDLERNWPAYVIYQRIYTQTPTSLLADQARFSAFSVMLDERQWQLAIADGYEYVEKRSQGEFIDDVTLNLMQLHMQQERFELAYEMGKKGLELSPEHKYIDQVKYLMGYIRFADLDYAIALDHFTEVLNGWPESRYYESADYWRCMSQLFLGRFEDAVDGFKGYLSSTRYDPRIFAEDGSYRLGIALYGAERYEESESTLKQFVGNYPNSTLLSEAYAMLGDLRGEEGDLATAIEYYQLAREKALNLSQFSYALFQSAKVLELEKRYQEIIELMDSYLAKWGAQSDFANAANWKGKCYKALDDYPRAIEAYFATIDAYGGNADITGVDPILNEVVSDYQSEKWTAYREIIIIRLEQHLNKALEGNQKTLQLYYQTVLARILKGEEREKLVNQIVQSKNVPASGAGTLVLIAQEGVRRKDYEIVHDAYRRFMSTFKTSNEMLYIMNANLDALIGGGNYDEALDLSEQILQKFGYSPSVGWARKRRGDVFRLQRDFERAIEAYKELLGIREWRGPLTPEALYYTGTCKMELKNIEEAYAYFQRVYVLYEEHVQWVAPAYAKSIECLERLDGREQEIINTCKEMLANEAVAATKEGRAARKRLESLGIEEGSL